MITFLLHGEKIKISFIGQITSLPCMNFTKSTCYIKSYCLRTAKSNKTEVSLQNQEVIKRKLDLQYWLKYFKTLSIEDTIIQVL